ncbi:hypothetical protein [Actinacidiphila epipremni]|jgi:hypothetical protein|uniref:Integral membrane protein n=1 Tax=Actinacidiphila epipremni TaxID=2053013 RepID=A0ABX0ZMZ9_9ACTN|nr:hypothetical protein [Actinacidiphila epipremni]NJP42983.1 hypothetical protein [Actinacidiphila epipremni]
MAQHAAGPHRLTFNTDGRRHPLVNSLAIVTLVLGGIAAISSIWSNLHLLSSWTGLVGIFTGGFGQFISVTTAERFALIIGLGASAVGFYIGVAHGGLTGGLW